MMSVEIDSALTPDEWQSRKLNGEHWNHPRSLFALWNHDLPDSSPLKFTRKDVQDLESAASALRWESGSDDDDAACLDRLRAKIEALLSPDFEITAHGDEERHYLDSTGNRRTEPFPEPPEA